MTLFYRISAFLVALTLGVFASHARTCLLTDSMRMTPLPVYDASHPGRIMRFSPVVAVGNASSINNYRSAIPGLTDIQTAPDLMLRAGLHVDFFIHRSLVLTTGLEGSVSNSHVALGIINEPTNTIASAYITHHYYEAIVPVLVNFRLNLGWRIKGSFSIGAYLAEGLGGNTKASGYSSGINSLGQPVIDHLYYKKDYYSEDMSVVNNVKKFDYGPRICAGLILRNRFTSNLVFQTSARNLATNHNVLGIKYRHISFAIEFGYSF